MGHLLTSGDFFAGHRDIVSHVVKQKDAIFVFQSPLNPGNRGSILYFSSFRTEVPSSHLGENVPRWKNVAGNKMYIHISRVAVLTVQGIPEFADHMEKHGDGVKDIAFAVEDLEYIVDVAKRRGAEIVRDITDEKDDFGIVRYATVKTVS